MMFDEWVSLRRWVVAVLVPLLALWPATAGSKFEHAHDGHASHVHSPLEALALKNPHHGHEPAILLADDVVGPSHAHGSHPHTHQHSHDHDQDDHHLGDADVVVMLKLTQSVSVMLPLPPCITILPPQVSQVLEQGEQPVTVAGAGEQRSNGSRVAGILRAGHALLL